MKLSGKRGFTGIEIMLIIAVFGAVTYFTAPSVGKAVNNVFTGTKNQQKQTHKVTEQYSMFYKDDKGNFKPAPIPYKRTEEGLNFVNTEPPETLWTKFVRLGAMSVVIIVVLSYLGLLPIIRVWWNLKVKPKLIKAKEDLETLQVEQDQLSDDARLIVRSVDEGLAAMDSAIASANMTIATVTNLTDSPTKLQQMAVAQAVLMAMTNCKKEFLTAMSRKQNSTTKLLVSELKND